MAGVSIGRATSREQVGNVTIPKVIHYCWFGERPHSQFMVHCMDSWRRLLPDYRIIEWNETNFDVNSHEYTKEAYQARKYAFVTDYVRLKVLFDHGGVYLDTDVELLKPLDQFLVHQAFSGFEDEMNIPTAVMGSIAANEWIRVLLAEYEGLHFVGSDGAHDLTTNVSRITQTTQACFGVSMDNSFQDIPGVLTLYPKDYFCPKSYTTGIVARTPNTHAIHHFAGSWKPEERRALNDLRGRINRVFGIRFGGWILAARHVYKAEGASALPGRALRALRKQVAKQMDPPA